MSTQPATAVSLPPDKDMGGGLITFMWTLSGVSALILSLRLFAVYKVLNRVRVADYLMVASFICIIITSVLITKSCEYGLGRHIYYLTPDQIEDTMKYITIMVGPSILAIMLARLSFCAFLLATFGPKKIARIILWGAIISQILINMSQFILQYASCGLHFAAQWDHTIAAKCIRFGIIIDYIYFLSAWNAVTDLVLTILPLTLLRTLKIPFKKKVIIMILLCLSGFAFIASLVRCIMTKEMLGADITWTLAQLGYWIMAECHVIIIVASIPLLNSLVKWSKETITQRSYGSANRTVNRTANQSVSQSTNQSTNHVMVNQSWAVDRESSIDAEKLSNQQSTVSV